VRPGSQVRLRYRLEVPRILPPEDER